MHKLPAFSLALAATIALTPLSAEAKRYHGDASDNGSRVHRHSRASDASGETSRSCLTSEARALLRRIENQFGNVEIVSTCRPGARIAASGRPSKHASGEAIDFLVRGRKGEVVRWLSEHHSGGTMTYSDMDHIHVDVGPHFVALNRPSGH